MTLNEIDAESKMKYLDIFVYTKDIQKIDIKIYNGYT